ncbi:L3/FP4 protein [Finch poxvirus]|uniref:L3/FP4 protein n=2 Tax=unclassified Avipoxvirus TaxID=336487 RepID=A0AAT9UQI1_9POXV|nr:L3/FP4 protein [Finch poxvirus]UOX39170.1 L3/FP4 protein [Finch poxvirus]
MSKNNATNESNRQIPFTEQRLCNYYQEKKRYDLSCYIGEYFNIRKQVCTEEANCWVVLSALVKAGKALGFPLIYSVRDHQYGRTIYFEYFKDMKRTNLDLQNLCLSKDIVLQMTAILYSLYKNNIFSDDFKFDIVAIPRSTISMSINHLVLLFATESLVLLSINTHLYKAELPQSCYLDYIAAHRDMMTRRNLQPVNYFFEWFIRNHLENISRQYLDIFKIKKNYINTSQIHRLIEPGSLVYVMHNDSLIVGITLSEVSINNIVRVIYSVDGGSIFEIDDFYTHDVFMANELISRSKLVNINL